MAFFDFEPSVIKNLVYLIQSCSGNWKLICAKPIYSVTHAESEQLNYGYGHPLYHSAVKQINELEKVESPSKALIKLAEEEKLKRLQNVKFKKR